MTILPVSDLHIDFSENYIFCRKTDALNGPPVIPDVLVIAGDMSQFNYKKRTHFIQKIILPRYPLTIAIPGNHEFYGCHADDYRFGAFHEMMTCEDTGNTIHVMNNATLDVGDVRFICTTLWSPVLKNPGAIIRGMNDYNYIKGFTVDINNSLNAEAVEFLEKELRDMDYSKKAGTFRKVGI